MYWIFITCDKSNTKIQYKQVCSSHVEQKLVKSQTCVYWIFALDLSHVMKIQCIELSAKLLTFFTYVWEFHYLHSNVIAAKLARDILDIASLLTSIA